MTDNKSSITNRSILVTSRGRGVADYDEQLVPQVGKRFVTEIPDGIEMLTNNPVIGELVPEFDTDKVHELIHKPFRVVYLRESTSIVIIRVWRSERVQELPRVRMKHNNTFEYVPALRASTGPKKVAPFWTD